MKQYVVRNWEKFQHYSDRNPPWIKLHFALLASEDWVMLDDASRVLAIVCMLLASRNKGMINDNLSYIQRVGYLKKLPDLKPLIDCGFLIELQADASTLQADASGCKQTQATARPEKKESLACLSKKESKKERKKIPKKEIFVLPDWIPKDDWEAWLEIRKKNTNTPHALKLAVGKLEELGKQGFTPQVILQHCILSGWQGIFPPKTDNWRSKTGYEPMPSVAGG